MGSGVSVPESWLGLRGREAMRALLALSARERERGRPLDSGLLRSALESVRAGETLGRALESLLRDGGGRGGRVPVGVYLSSDALEKVDELARERGVSRSRVVEDLLREALGARG
ncbi:MAG: CopG family transcriptional regulator [Candidatus Korarchaeota archaeon]|nr:CopG family transcriptional regulator [Candidatus Korarchaeota archaeon]